MDKLIDQFMSRKGLFVSFWVVAIIMVTALVYYSAGLVKEVPPIPSKVVSESGELLYSQSDIIAGKGFFQEFDLQDYGTMLGMGAYLGPDFPTTFLHKRAEYLYNYYAHELFGTASSSLDEVRLGGVKARVIKDIKKQTKLTDGAVVYSNGSTEAFKANKEYLIDFLVNGNKPQGYPGGVIRKDEAAKIADFFDWSQLVASTLRPNTNRTWSNNWPHEPLIDQDTGWDSIFWSLIQLLMLWTFTIIVFYLLYEHFIKKDDGKLENPLKITKLFPSQYKLTKYIPVVTLFFFLQTVLGGYISHIYTDPANNFLLSQSILPFNVMRAMHINIAIIWVAIGWLVGGMFIAPLAGGEDTRFPWLVDVLWLALLIVGGGGLVGIYMGATGQLRDVWFWLGNEGREYLNLSRVWDIALVGGLVLWFLMVFTTIRKAKTNNVLIGTIIWSAFGLATLYIAGMMPINKIFPNYTIDDYYRWWVVHLWVELTFELFAAGTLAYLAVSLGLVTRKMAERVMLFELLLISFSGTLG
ncbi:MAG: nitric oxide reductase subunit, partial [Bacteroidota bacterium]|nr:nitric oxide reductase subunit [Bacteroidota bacterium]